MQRANRLLAARNRYIVDVPYDGSCVVWTLVPLLERHFKLRLSVSEARTILVETMHHDRFRADLERNAPGDTATREQRLREFARPNAYVDPILAAKVAEWLTAQRVRVYSYDNSGQLIDLYREHGDGDEDGSDPSSRYDVELFFDPILQHMTRVNVHERPFGSLSTKSIQFTKNKDYFELVRLRAEADALRQASASGGADAVVLSDLVGAKDGAR